MPIFIRICSNHGVETQPAGRGRFSPAGSGIPAYGSRDLSASENLALKCVPCYNTRRHRNSVFRLLLHRREPDCKWDTPERFAEQGNWVQLPDTFPGQGRPAGICSCEHRAAVLSAKAGHWRAVMAWLGRRGRRADAGWVPSASGYASQKTYKTVVCVM